VTTPAAPGKGHERIVAMGGPVSYDKEYNERLGFGTDQGRWLADQFKEAQTSNNRFRCALLYRVCGGI
jgi:hypothetical protein